MNVNVSLNVITPESLVSADQGREILLFLSEHLPDYMPEICGAFEPLDRKFDVHCMEDALSEWRFPSFFARRHKPKMEMSVFMRRGKATHAWLSITLAAAERIPQNRLIAFLQGVSVRFAADFAMMQLVTKAELEKGRLTRSIVNEHLITTTHILKHYIPELYWLTVLGPPYVELFSRPRVLSAPAASIEQLPYGGVAIRLTNDIFDATRDPRRFDEMRDAIKYHLNTNAFFDPGASATHVYTIAPCF